MQNTTHSQQLAFYQSPFLLVKPFGKRLMTNYTIKFMKINDDI